VDYPGFNLRFAAKIHGTGPKVIYYICPQVWAWHRSRIPDMARIMDRLITIFPFEAGHFEGTGLHVDFAGHPLVDEARHALDEVPPELPWKGNPRIALLPGSRVQVIENVLPTMWAAARQLESSHPDCSFILPAPLPKTEQILREHIGRLPAGPARWEIVTGNTRQVLRQASAAMVASGTATIETSLMLCPMIVVYRMPAMNFFLARRLVRVENIGMVNIVAGKKICPEFIQDQATPATLAEGIQPLLAATPERATMVDELRRANAALGPGGAAARAAEAVLAALKRPSFDKSC
jgi:lipid-A-disaccharide synthase